MKCLILLCLIASVLSNDTRKTTSSVPAPLETFPNTRDVFGNFTRGNIKKNNRGVTTDESLLPLQLDSRKCVRCMAFCNSDNLVCVSECLGNFSCFIEHYKVELSEPDDTSLRIIFEQAS